MNEDEKYDDGLRQVLIQFAFMGIFAYIAYQLIGFEWSLISKRQTVPT